MARTLTASALGDLGGLLEHRHELAAYCPRCRRWAVLPLEQLVARGEGSRRLPIVVRCRECGEPGCLHVRPPVPPRRRGGWMEPT